MIALSFRWSFNSQNTQFLTEKSLIAITNTNFVEFLYTLEVHKVAITTHISRLAKNGSNLMTEELANGTYKIT
jgi:hypothetical protein